MNTIVSFVAKVAKQGDLRLVIIPKRDRARVKDYVGEHVKITLEEIIPQD